MKAFLTFLLSLSLSGPSFAAMISEVVYVESPTDTDSDGNLDRIYVSISRPNSDRKLSTIFTISPYALGGNNIDMHDVNLNRLPQDEELSKSLVSSETNLKQLHVRAASEFPSKYAEVKAHSLGTGRSTGCPTVGDISETMAAKAVIDWLNGRARAFYDNGQEAKADWANGLVGMTGTSYDGTLPIMVATTGVEGLKAIVPIAAISNWYDYYRANGLVVNPGGYIGEDADILGHFIVRRGSCKNELKTLAQSMGRENGDFTTFWQKRDYISKAKKIKAATFIIHGQSDWNVKQKNAIQLWSALEGVAPRRMFLHKGGHGSTSGHGVPKKIQAWFDHFLEGENNGITEGPQVEVEMPNGSLIRQSQWPAENSKLTRFYFAPDGSLPLAPSEESQFTIVDSGRSERLGSLVANPIKQHEGRVVFLTAPLATNALLTGTARIRLNLSVMNRRAANITVALVEYDKRGNGKIITRGWADPQNHRSVARGELLIPGLKYNLSFDLEPKQYQFSAGNKIGVVITSTDYEYTLRPEKGTIIQFNFDRESFIDLRL